jgi:23S rRNA (adenine2503-C2)-methyltransferase
MKVKRITVPTGDILIFPGAKGKPLEVLSLGDYGKEKNIKADFLGLKNEINSVPHGDCMPLEEKWVITISSQYGCSMGCQFCDVPKVGPGLNATREDLFLSFKVGIAIHPEIEHTKRLNLHFARMGEPTFNPDVIMAAYDIKLYLRDKGLHEGFHPVVSTMMPVNNSKLSDFIKDWLVVKNMAQFGNAGLQISVNTTDEVIRKTTMPYSMTLKEISKLMNSKVWLAGGIKGRKLTLNFAITDAPIDAKLLRELFDPTIYMCKITPMHKTHACEENNLITTGGYDSYYPYRQAEKDLRDVGFDVIMFVPSVEEDLGRITCGNAILSGNLPEVGYKETMVDIDL